MEWDGAGTWILGMDTPAKVKHGDGGESAVRAIDADTLELRTERAADGCVVGDTGTYDWTLSNTGRILQLDPVADQCEPRMADLDGDWIVSDCPVYPEDFCLGPLDPGPHVANYFTPKTPSSAWELDPAAMSYRVPEGWWNTYDSANEYALNPPAGRGDTGVYMWTDVTLASETNPCGPRPDTAERATPAEFAAWLMDHSSLDVSDAAPTSVGGLDGLAVDVAVASGAGLPCFGDGPYAPMLVHVEGSGLQWGFKAGVRNRVYFLDLGDGRTLVIHVAAEGDTADQHLREGLAIVESIDLR
jgi:hypothetical protein